MNSKGIYTALAAFVALAVIAGALFYVRIPMNESRTRVTAKNTSEIVTVWQNARYLYDKTVAEAIWDQMYTTMGGAGSCSTDTTGVDAEISNYLASMRTDIEDGTGFACTLSGTPNVAGANITILNAALKCENNLQKIEIENAINISKTASTFDLGSGSCEIIITDDASGVEDIRANAPY